jgi:hypothetical protein
MTFGEPIRQWQAPFRVWLITRGVRAIGSSLLLAGGLLWRSALRQLVVITLSAATTFLIGKLCGTVVF